MRSNSAWADRNWGPMRSDSAGPDRNCDPMRSRAAGPGPKRDPMRSDTRRTRSKLRSDALGRPPGPIEIGARYSQSPSRPDADLPRVLEQRADAVETGLMGFGARPTESQIGPSDRRAGPLVLQAATRRERAPSKRLEILRTHLQPGPAHVRAHRIPPSAWSSACLGPSDPCLKPPPSMSEVGWTSLARARRRPALTEPRLTPVLRPVRMTRVTLEP